MNRNSISWKKVVFTIVWTLVAAATAVLLVAAAQHQAGKRCAGVVVQITSADGTEYVSKKQILAAISGGRPDLLPGSPIRTFDLNQLEALLRENLWIRNAELFFDNNDVLHVEVEERQPVARVFASGGETFYVDDAYAMLPVTTEQVARVPVFTGFPVLTYPLKGRDSVLLIQVQQLGAALLKDPFWMAQVDQVHINNYEFELVPKLGQHLVLFGNAEQASQKLDRLLLFYKQVLKKTGWNYYSTLDVRFNKQLVAHRRDSASLFRSFQLTNDTTYRNTIENGMLPATNTSAVAPNVTDSNAMTAPAADAVTQKPPTVPMKSVPKPSKPAVQMAASPASAAESDVLQEARQQQMPKAAGNKKEPKAVMPKKNN